MIDERYIRNLNALSEAECKALKDKRILVAGSGGLGCYVIEACARLGIGHISAVDFDVFCESNLNRQLYSLPENLGKHKVDVAAERVAALNPDVDFVTIKEKITRENCEEITRGFDLVIDCLDSYESRFWLATGAGRNATPIIFGAIAGWFGQVCTVYPGDTTFVDIYGSMEDGESASSAEGNLAFTAGLVANIQAAQAVSVLLDKPGVLRNKILMIDLLNASFEVMPLC